MTTDYTELKKLAEAAYPTTEDMHPTGIALANIQRGAFAKGAEAILCRAAASAPRAELTDERAAFEAWAELTASQAQGTCHDITGWYYFDDVTNDRWEAWQARAVLAQAAPVAVPSFSSAGRYCMSEDRCIAEGIDFASYEQGVLDAIHACERIAKRRAAPAAPVAAVAAGWKLVPEHPEQAMINAFIEEYHRPGGNESGCYRAFIAAAPAAPVAAAVPAGWIRNTGKQPVANDVLVVIVNQTGFTDVAQASHFCWDIEGFEQDIVHFCVLPAAPAPVDRDAA